MMKLFDMPLEEMKKYKPALTKKADFEIFWENNLSQSGKQNLNIELDDNVLPYWLLLIFGVGFICHNIIMQIKCLFLQGLTTS